MTVIDPQLCQPYNLSGGRSRDSPWFARRADMRHRQMLCSRTRPVGGRAPRCPVRLCAAQEPSFLILTDPAFEIESLLKGLDRTFPQRAKVGGVASGGEQANNLVLYLEGRAYRSGAVNTRDAKSKKYTDKLALARARAIRSARLDLGLSPSERQRLCLRHQLDGRLPPRRRQHPHAPVSRG